MDTIIEEIYSKTPDAFILVTGDHGMRDSGGHGGSTHPETNVPLIALNLPCRNDTFPQIDIPANLAVILNFDIPTTSIGQLRQSLLAHLTQSEFIQAVKYNTLLLRNKLDLCQESSETADHFFDLFRHNEDFGQKAATLYENCAKKISETLLKTSIRQNLTSLIVATATAILVVVKIFQQFSGIYTKPGRVEQILILAVLSLQFLQLHVILDFVHLAVILILLWRNLVCFENKHLRCVDVSFLTFMSILHPFSFLSSSFLEEEHQFWYFFTNTFILLNILKDFEMSWFLLFVTVRFIRTINQVGDKWAAVPDLADWLLQIENYVFLQFFFISSLILSYFSNNLFTKSKVWSIFDGSILFLIYIFRSVAKENIVLGQILWFSIFLRLLLTKKNFLQVWVLVISLLLKPYNVILIPVCVFASQLFHKTLKNESLIMSHWWLGNLLFFAQGHDNSLASVDISAGYIGLHKYNPLLVFPQVLCHTYALPVLSHLLLFTNRNVKIFKSFSIFIFFRLYVVVLVFVVTFIHRHHLFIWSVFAPKMFAEASHFGFLFIELCCYYLIDVIKRLIKRK